MNGDYIYLDPLPVEDEMLGARVDVLRLKYPHQCIEADPLLLSPKRYKAIQILERKRHG